MKKILVTGAAGFIGRALCERLLSMGHIVIGVDNINGYYDPNLKLLRLETLKGFQNFTFSRLDISNKIDLEGLFQKYSFN